MGKEIKNQKYMNALVKEILMKRTADNPQIAGFFNNLYSNKVQSEEIEQIKSKEIWKVDFEESKEFAALMNKKLNEVIKGNVPLLFDSEIFTVFNPFLKHLEFSLDYRVDNKIHVLIYEYESKTRSVIGSVLSKFQKEDSDSINFDVGQKELKALFQLPKIINIETNIEKLWGKNTKQAMINAKDTVTEDHMVYLNVEKEVDKFRYNDLLLLDFTLLHAAYRHILLDLSKEYNNMSEDKLKKQFDILLNVFSKNSIVKDAWFNNVCNGYAMHPIINQALVACEATSPMTLYLYLLEEKPLNHKAMLEKFPEKKDVLDIGSVENCHINVIKVLKQIVKIDTRILDEEQRHKVNSGMLRIFRNENLQNVVSHPIVQNLWDKVDSVIPEMEEYLENNNNRSNGWLKTIGAEIKKYREFDNKEYFVNLKNSKEEISTDTLVFPKTASVNVKKVVLFDINVQQIFQNLKLVDSPKIGLFFTIAMMELINKSGDMFAEMPVIINRKDFNEAREHRDISKIIASCDFSQARVCDIRLEVKSEALQDNIEKNIEIIINQYAKLIEKLFNNSLPYNEYKNAEDVLSENMFSLGFNIRQESKNRQFIGDSRSYQTEGISLDQILDNLETERRTILLSSTLEKKTKVKNINKI